VSIGDLCSTSWKPTCEVMLVNAAHIKNVSGRQTEIKDAIALAYVVAARTGVRQFHYSIRAGRLARLGASRVPISAAPSLASLAALIEE